MELSFIKKFLFGESKVWTFGQIQNVGSEKYSEQKVEPRKAYMNIFLESLHIPYSRRGTGKYHGAVYSFTSLPSLTGGDAQFNTVIAPKNLRDMDKSHVDRVLVGRHSLLGAIPYRGGNVKFEIGLFSIKSSDLAGPYLEVLQTLA